MTSRSHQKVVIGTALGMIVMALSACGPRVIITTGTTIGLKATPGDGATRPPQVTLAYKRTEFALVPTGNQKATPSTDAFSTLAAINFFSEWFGQTQIRSLLGTGIAARDIQEHPAEMADATTQTPKIPASPKSEKLSFWPSYKKTPNIQKLFTADGTSSSNRAEPKTQQQNPIAGPSIFWQSFDKAKNQSGE